MGHTANYEEHGMELREQSFSLPFLVLTSLFFMWGLVIGLNTALLENFKLVFSLSINQALTMQFAFFATYFVVAVPAGKLIDSLGYKNGIVAGLVLSGIGAILFVPAADSQSYNLLLFAMFFIGRWYYYSSSGSQSLHRTLWRPKPSRRKAFIKARIQCFGINDSSYYPHFCIVFACTCKT